MPNKKSAKEVRHSSSLIIGPTFATTLGNHTVTHIHDPKTLKDYSVTLYWEKQYSSSNSAVPFNIQISSGVLSPNNSADIDRKLGINVNLQAFPLNSTLLRRIPYEKIIDESRKALISNNAFYFKNEITLIHPLTSRDLKPQKRKGRPFDRDDSFYHNIAKYYQEAKNLGGSVARKPALYIEDFVFDEVKHLRKDRRAVQIRKWVAESRKRGYLEPAKEN